MRYQPRTSRNGYLGVFDSSWTVRDSIFYVSVLLWTYARGDVSRARISPYSEEFLAFILINSGFLLIYSSYVTRTLVLETDIAMILRKQEKISACTIHQRYDCEGGVDEPRYDYYKERTSYDTNG